MTTAYKFVGPPIALAAVALGFLVSQSQWVLAVGLVFAVAIWLVVAASELFLACLLATATLIEPPVADVSGIPSVHPVEIVVPALLLVLALRSITGQRGKASAAYRSHSRVISIAVLLYALVIVCNYLRSKYLMGAVVAGTRRTFYEYFVALGAFLIFYVLFRSQDFPWRAFLRYLLGFSVIASLIGVAAVVLHVPLNFGNLRYSVYDYTSGGVRVGFLETFGTIGLALTLAMGVRYRMATGALFVAALVASGGRAAVVGVVIAIALYLAGTRRSWQVLAIGSTAVVLALAIPGLGSSPQVQRLSQLNQQELSSDGRLFLYNESLRAFAQQPLVGTGVGVHTPVYNPEAKLAAFYEAQLEVGGHTTYTSLLKNFGLVGFVPFAMAVAAAILGLGAVMRSNVLAAFFFIFIAAEAVTMLVSGNGSDPVYFFALAGGSATLASSAPVRWRSLVVRRSSSGRSMVKRQVSLEPHRAPYRAPYVEPHI